MNKPYFEPEHRAELKRIFTDLADFIHEGRFQRIFSCGPSATPFAKAAARAYRQRHGSEIEVESLGLTSESLAVLAPTSMTIARGIFAKKGQVLTWQRKRFCLTRFPKKVRH